MAKEMYPRFRCPLCGMLAHYSMLEKAPHRIEVLGFYNDGFARPKYKPIRGKAVRNEYRDYLRKKLRLIAEELGMVLLEEELELEEEEELEAELELEEEVELEEEAELEGEAEPEVMEVLVEDETLSPVIQETEASLPAMGETEASSPVILMSPSEFHDISKRSLRGRLVSRWKVKGGRDNG